MKKRIVFIINPISGVFRKSKIPFLIRKYLDAERFIPEIVFTQYTGHAKVIAQEYAAKGFDYVIAVGGDGTMNETAAAISHTDAALGIIPAGSGNGLARHLNISLRTKKAIKQLNESTVSVIDYCLINDKPFFCTCGVGFDAYISMEFCKVKKRGFFSYLLKIIAAFFVYKPGKYHLKSKEKEIETTAFLVTIGNASQWGNAAYVAPKASLKDGFFNVVILKNVNFLNALWLALKLYKRKIDNNKYIETWETEELIISSETEMPSHLDGEPFEKGHEFHIRIVPEGLKVFCSKSFQ